MIEENVPQDAPAPVAAVIDMTPTPEALAALRAAVAFYEEHPEKYSYTNAFVPQERLDDPMMPAICPLALLAKLMGFPTIHQLDQPFYQKTNASVEAGPNGAERRFWLEQGFFRDLEVAGNDTYSRWRYDYNAMMTNMRALLAAVSLKAEVTFNG